MRQIYFVLLLISTLVLASFTRTHKFPEFNYQTIKGTSVTNEIFNGKNTMVIMAHLGCPAAMMLFKDLEELKPEPFQILIILENTPQQVLDFNSPDKNDWSGIRNYFGLKSVEYDIIAECDNPNLIKSGDDIRVETQCRKLSRKIKTKDSPTLVKVNEKGEIVSIIKGYFGDKEQSERLRKFAAL